MDLLSLCPLPAAQLIWRPSPSRWAITVVCKATYRLEPGILELAEQQEPILHEESHWEDDPHRSLFAPADVVPVKPRADVVLIGTAYARGGRPVRSLVARMSVGRVDKSIEVRCPLSRTQAGEVREGKPWTKMPLSYERAAGGPGTDNPAGIGPDGPPDARGAFRLPNLQPPGFSMAGGQFPPPIGFGPIAAHWPFRAAWAPRVAPPGDMVRGPFGDGFDPAFFQAAPPDQQLDALRPNERITLENLHPRHARLVARLPGAVLHARLEPRGEGPREASLVPDTLWIDTRRAICTVTHRARFDVEHPEQDGRIVVTMLDAADRPSPTLENTARILPPPATLPAPVSPPPLVAPAAVMPPAPVTPPAPVMPPAPLPPPPLVAPAPVMPPPLVSSPPHPAPSAPALLPAALPEGGTLGLLSASNAAAAAPPEPVSLPEPAARPPRAPSAPPVVEIVWFDDTAPLRLSRHPDFAAWKRPPPDAADGKPDSKALTALHRAHVHDALTRGPLSTAGALDAALEEAEEHDPPAPALVLVGGTLDLCLDEAAGAAARDAWTKANRLLSPEQLAAWAERQLLEQRAYHKREFAGETWIVARLGGPGWEPPLPVYLPERIARRLPLFRRFSARILGEVIWPQDQFEAHPLALRPLALGRLPVRSGIRARRGPAAAAR